jgi:hypothetical protein
MLNNPAGIIDKVNAIVKTNDNTFFIFVTSHKIKSAATEAAAQKTQTPIVAKLYRYEKHYVITPKEFAFLSNSGCD